MGKRKQSSHKSGHDAIQAEVAGTFTPDAKVKATPPTARTRRKRGSPAGPKALSPPDRVESTSPPARLPKAKPPSTRDGRSNGTLPISAGSPNRSANNGEDETVDELLDDRGPAGLDPEIEAEWQQRSLEDMAFTINMLHEHASMRFAQYACQAGEWLVRAKGRVPRKFVAWVEESCKFSYSTAALYMRIFNRWDDVVRQNGGDMQRVADSHLRDIAEGLVKTKRPKAARPKVGQQGSDRRAKPDEPEGREDAAWAEQRPEDSSEDRLSNEEWLTSIPLRSQLANPSTFDEQALLWRQIRPGIDELIELYTPTPEDIRKAGVLGFLKHRLEFRVAFLTAVKDPHEWTICFKCKGAHTDVPGKIPCPICGGQGFEIGHEADPAPVVDEDE